MLEANDTVRLLARCDDDEPRIAAQVYVITRTPEGVTHWLYESGAEGNGGTTTIDAAFIQKFGTFDPTNVNKVLRSLKELVVTNNEATWRKICDDLPQFACKYAGSASSAGVESRKRE